MLRKEWSKMFTSMSEILQQYHNDTVLIFYFLTDSFSVRAEKIG